MLMAASARSGSPLSSPVAVEGSCAIGAGVGVGFDVTTGVAAGVGLAALGVGVGVATAHAAAEKVTVFETVTWLLAIRTNPLNVPPPEPPNALLRSIVAVIL